MSGIQYEQMEKWVRQLQPRFQRAMDEGDSIEAERISDLQYDISQAIIRYYDSRLKEWWNTLSPEAQKDHIRQVEEKLKQSKH